MWHVGGWECCIDELYWLLVVAAWCLKGQCQIKACHQHQAQHACTRLTCMPRHVPASTTAYLLKPIPTPTHTLTAPPPLYPTGEDAIPGSERALMRGLVRRTWTGAPWLDSLAAGPMDLTKLPTMKRQKGKKKDLSSGLDLSRIMGYNADAPEPAEPAPAADSDDGGSEEDDGVVGRNFIKVRAAKMAARHHAALKLRGE
jgi:hypothetical protein